MDPMRVLVIGPDAVCAAELDDLLRSAGATCLAVVDRPASAAPYLRDADAILADASSLQADDVQLLLDDASRDGRTVPCLLARRGASVDDAVDLMRRGAFAVLGLPANRTTIEMHLSQAARHRELQARNAELERSLESHERLAMIGKLAAGVAHELNNPLDGVLRYVNLSIQRLPQESEQVTYLLQARQGLRRMADIVRDLLQFSRNANVDSADEDALRIARDATEQVVHAALPRRIEATYDFPPAGIHVPRAVFQVIGNLAKNAVDAMPSGGKLRISAALANGRVRIAVADTGSGIPDEIRERIFEPFFTTKEVGKGTGLGLSISQRIVERLGGTLAIESEVGRGTTVYVDLPARTRGAAAQAAIASTSAKSKSPAASDGRRAEGVF